MMLLNAVRDLCLHAGVNKTYWVAFSGGLDSQVLLSLATQLRAEMNIDVRAIHVNHHLHPDAGLWVSHCQKTCAALAVNLTVCSISLDLSDGESLEELAREKRYANLAEYIGDGVLLTAHHQDDQAETVVLQLLRGAGPKGLAAMPAVKAFGRGLHARPLLAFSRAQLLKYAKENNLQWIEDTSNQDISYTRNFIRHQILAPVIKRWPTAMATISRSAAHCAETEDLLNELMQADYAYVCETQNNLLSISKLKELSQEKQKWILRAWIERNGFELPSVKKLMTILHDVLFAGPDRMPSVSWGEATIRRYRDHLYLLNEHEANVSIDKQSYSWNRLEPLHIPGVGVLHAEASHEIGLQAGIKDLTVRFREPGETVTLSNRGRHSLKNLFQEWGVLPWERDRLPLLFVGDLLVAAVGYFYNTDFMTAEGELGWRIKLEK